MRSMWIVLWGSICVGLLIGCSERGAVQSDVVVSPRASATVVLPTATVIPTVEPATSVPATATPQLVETAVVVFDEVLYLQPEVVAVYPHDPAAFTQGLLWDDGGFYESTGLRGESSVRRVALDGTVEQIEPVDEAYFAEGLVLVDERLIQLTWQSQVALVYERETLQEVGRFTYTGEGWGICLAEETGILWMSDGSSRLVARDAATFERLSEIEVMLEGEPVVRLNELECVGNHIYANVWQTDLIMQIEQESGRVSAVVDASGLLPAEERVGFSSNDVLNGIAYDPEQALFYLTGKRWPQLFAVRFIPLP